MPSHYDIEMRLDVRVPMRDGVALSTDLYLPKDRGPFPAVLVRTPYGNNMEALIEKARRLANRGYVCALQDTRGRWDSEGDYEPLVTDGEDGFDTQEWIGRQEWSNGRIGMSGGSYLGWVQWASAPLGSRYLTCMAPRVICTEWFKGLVYLGGALQWNVLMTWGMRTNSRTGQSIDFHHWTEVFRGLPLNQADELAGRNLPFFKNWIAHPTYDDYWKALDVSARWSDITAPAFNMGGWYDLYAQHTFENFNGLRAHGATPEARRSRLIIGPWAHSLSVASRTGDIDFGPHSQVDLDALELRWLDHWLKGISDGIVDEPPLRLFIMGINEWRDEHEWPLARTNWQRWHLHSRGSANSVLGDGALAPEAPEEEPADRFTYDPRYPVQTMGGNNCCSPHIVPWGPYDQRPVEMRGDVLCYTSGVLTEDLEVTGPITLVLYAETDAPDTDWTGKLVDVWPSGYAMNLCDGILRARYRESRTDPTLLEPGKVYRYEVDLGVTGHVFKKGHAVRLEVSSSNFPRFDRNPNTGHALGVDTEQRPAHQTVHHSAACPSHLVLPVIPHR